MNHAQVIGKFAGLEGFRQGVEGKSDFIDFGITTRLTKVENGEVVNEEVHHPIRITDGWIKHVDMLKEGCEVSIEGYLINTEEEGGYRIKVQELIIL